MTTHQPGNETGGTNQSVDPTFHAFLGASLDGYIAGPHGELDWLMEFNDRLGDTGYDSFFASIDAMVMGRNTYDVMRDLDPGYYKNTPIHVLSRNLPAGPQPDLGASPVTTHPDLSTVRARLAADGAKRAYVDGGATVQAFLTAGLLSDLILTTVPILIGRGVPLFGPVPAPTHAELIQTRELGAGAVQSTYRFRNNEG